MAQYMHSYWKRLVMLALYSQNNCLIKCLHKIYDWENCILNEFLRTIIIFKKTKQIGTSTTFSTGDRIDKIW